MDLTVVTVVKNAAVDLLQTAASVNRQTCRHRVEYLVIDGASTDGTADVLRGLAERGEVDQWVSEPDAGIYDAMNKALRRAQGRWVLFLNSGDVFHGDDSLEALWRAAEERVSGPFGAVGVYGGCVQVLPDGRRVTSAPLPPRKIYTRMVCSHQSLLLATATAREYAFDPRFRIAADHHQLMRLVYRYEPVWPVSITVSEVRLERYTWAQLRRGLAEKRRALWEVTRNPVFLMFHWFRFLGVGLKHGLRRLLGR